MTSIEREAEIAELQAKFKELDQPKYETNPDFARQRGVEFEDLVRRLFNVWRMLRRRSYHTQDNKSEQIDGVVQFNERYALLEVKWEKSNLAASELFSFLGKVEGKFVGTIGIFISRNELTPNFLTALRTGRRQCIMVIHGKDVDRLFDPKFDLRTYLERHYMHVCIDNTCYLSADKYLAKLKKEAAAKPPIPPPDNVGNRINDCLNNKSTKNVVNEFAENFSENQRIQALQRIVSIYGDYAAGEEKSWKAENLAEFAKEIATRLPANFTAADTAFFEDILSTDFRNSHYHELLKLLAPRYQYLAPRTKEKIEDRLKRQWDKIIDEWVAENEMAVPTKALWEYLLSETKDHLIGHFVGFILSNRGLKHEQHRLARFVLQKDDSVPAAELALKNHAKKAARSWFEGEAITEAYIEKGKSRIEKSLSGMRTYINNFDQIVAQATDEAAAEA